MDTQSTAVSTCRGTPGLDIFKIAGRSISGFLPSFKTGDHNHVRQPFTTQLEERLALYLEYHPHVRTYQRLDASAAFAQAHHLHKPLETRIALRISTTETRMTTCLTLLGRCVMVAFSLQKLDEKVKNAKGKRWRKLKQRNTDDIDIFWIEEQ